MKSPLFVSDREVLKRKLRLSGSSDCKDIADLIDEAMCAARFRFYQDLGIDCVTQLLALAPEENPTTQDGLLRDLAELTEVRLVRLELSCLSPILFVDGAGKATSVWNEEGFTRDADPLTLEQLQKKWEAKVREGLDILLQKSLPDPIEQGKATCTVWSSQPVEEALSACAC